MLRRPVAGVQHIAARIGAAPLIIVLVRQGVTLQRGHLGAAVGQDDQQFLAVGQSLVHQRGKRLADAVGKFSLALAVGALAFAVGGDPGQVIRVVLHLDIIAPLKAAETHLFQGVHRHELCMREQHLRRLFCAL